MKHIEIAAGMGTGKTTLADLLGERGFHVERESLENNPFILKFYEDPARYAFETEVTFLMQHYHAIRNAEQLQGKGVVYDCAPILDWTYAQVNMTGQQQQAFHTLYESVKNSVRKPDLLVVLECAPAVQLERIRQRGRAFEGGVTADYLQSLSDVLRRTVFAESGYAHRILRIDTTALDLRRPSHAADVIGRIEAAAGLSASPRPLSPPRP